jgi:cadmium resistance protein CadD (predicted permease)
VEIFLTSLLAFVSTNIDDIFILTLFYGNRKYSDGNILAGQLIGIIFLISISLVGSLAGLFINKAYIGLLGLFPVYLGLKGIWDLLARKAEDTRTPDEQSGSRNSKMLAVAGVTIANGGDNIGIYIPLFATLMWLHKLIMIGIFLVMTFIWCLIAKYLTRHPYVFRQIDKYGHMVTPFVLVFLGIYILYESNSFQLLR